MNTTPLSFDDIHPYMQPNLVVVVRIFKNHKWFVGKLHYIKLDSQCIIRVEPMIKFIPHKSNLNPTDLNEIIITKDDQPILSSFTDSWPPFAPLINPEKLSTEISPNDLLVIKFEDGAAILSSREQDIKAVNDLFSLIERNNHK